MLSSSHPGELAELHTVRCGCNGWQACVSIGKGGRRKENTAWLEGVWLSMPKQNSPSSQNKAAPS